MTKPLGILLFRYFCWLAVVLLVTAVLFLLSFLVIKGIGTLNLTLFFGDTPPWQGITGKMPIWNGIWPALLGTGSLVCLTILLALFPGVGCGIFLAEYATGKNKAVANTIINILAGVPSIVMGLMGFIIILFLRNTFWPEANTALLLAAICLALLVLPVIVVTTKESLESLPKQLRITAISIGLTKGQYIRKILLPAASKGIFAGIVIAIGRSAEDTAVIMLTGAVANSGLPAGLGSKFEALPFHIYLVAAEYQTALELAQGFGAALVLLLFSATVMLLAAQLEKNYKKNSLKGR